MTFFQEARLVRGVQLQERPPQRNRRPRPIVSPSSEPSPPPPHDKMKKMTKNDEERLNQSSALTSGARIRLKSL